MKEATGQGSGAHSVPGKLGATVLAGGRQQPGDLEPCVVGVGLCVVASRPRPKRVSARSPPPPPEHVARSLW